jgi:hypothetical protein
MKKSKPYMTFFQVQIQTQFKAFSTFTFTFPPLFRSLEWPPFLNFMQGTPLVQNCGTKPKVKTSELFSTRVLVNVILLSNVFYVSCLSVNEAINAKY